MFSSRFSCDFDISINLIQFSSRFAGIYQFKKKSFCTTTFDKEEILKIFNHNYKFFIRKYTFIGSKCYE